MYLRSAVLSSPLIVVADDDPLYLEMISFIFQEVGFTQTYYTTGAEAFPLIRDRQPDLVLLDINPVNSEQGWNTLHLMRLNPATRTIPVLVCTTDPHLVHIKGAMLQAQDCEILEKPFDLEVLLNAITTLLEPRTKHRGSR